MSDETLNTLVGFGGVFVLGVIGALVHWYLGRREVRRSDHDDRTHRPGSAHEPAA